MTLRIAASLLLLSVAGSATSGWSAERQDAPDAEPEEWVPEPAGNPGEWASSHDYPPSALREEIEGVVRFTLTVNAQGRVEDCVVTGSSGSEVLDEATCQMIAARASFEPPPGPFDQAATGTWSSAVRWEIPETTPGVPPEVLSVVAYTVEPDGTVSDCEVERAEGDLPQIHNACAVPQFEVEPGPDGSLPPRRKVRVTFSVEHETLD